MLNFEKSIVYIKTVKDRAISKIVNKNKKIIFLLIEIN